jgi:hypothetical protein
VNKGPHEGKIVRVAIYLGKAIALSEGLTKHKQYIGCDC